MYAHKYINATKCKPKKYFSHKGGGGVNMYQFHQMHTQITRSNLMVRRTRLMVWSRVLKKGWLFFYIPFILLCNKIKQTEIVKNCGKH